MGGDSDDAPEMRARRLRPFIVIWETTRACALACVHCRAEAIAYRDPRELTTDEAFLLIDRVAAFGTRPPLLVLTGGDPLRRPDIARLVAHGSRARAFAASGDPLGEDPGCIWPPAPGASAP